MLLHYLHRGLHLALAPLLTPLYLLADGLEELGVLGNERGHLLALTLRHIAHLPLGIVLEEEILERHVGSIPQSPWWRVPSCAFLWYILGA